MLVFPQICQEHNPTSQVVYLWVSFRAAVLSKQRKELLLSCLMPKAVTYGLPTHGQESLANHMQELVFKQPTCTILFFLFPFFYTSYLW